MKKPTALQVKVAWDAHGKPSARAVAAALTDAGYDITYRTVSRYKAANWAEPHADAPKKKVEKLGKAVATAKKDIAVSGGPPVDREVLVNRLQRMNELYTRSLAENQVKLQQAGLIAGIVIAEEVMAMVGQLTITNPGDLARLLHAITEATQVKHVGGAGQVPALDDPRVIDAVPVTKNAVSEALARFRKNAGLKAG